MWFTYIRLFGVRYNHITPSLSLNVLHLTHGTVILFIAHLFTGHLVITTFVHVIFAHI